MIPGSQPPTSQPPLALQTSPSRSSSFYTLHSVEALTVDKDDSTDHCTLLIVQQRQSLKGSITPGCASGPGLVTNGSQLTTKPPDPICLQQQLW